MPVAPEFTDVDGVIQRVRLELYRERFVLAKVSGLEKPEKIPPFLIPLELGSFFVAVTTPDRP
jgi:hypothetical protein